MDATTLLNIAIGVYAYLAIGFQFAKFNRALWNAKISGKGFSPNVNFFGEGEKTHKICENLCFIALFPIATFFVAINQPGAHPLSFWSCYVCAEGYDQRNRNFVTILWPVKLAWNTLVIATLLIVIVPAMFVFSIIYSSLTIFLEKPTAEEKPKEAA